MSEVCKVPTRGGGNECRKMNCFYYKEDQITKGKEKCNRYKNELDIMNKMMEEKCDAYEAKSIRGYRSGRIYTVAAKNNKKKKPDKDKECKNTNRKEVAT